MPNLNFIPLASSSAGNAYLLEDGETKLLIECGVPHRRLQKLTGFGTAGITGCLLSHEHHDHAKCHEELIKSGVPVYASEGTAEALGCGNLTVLELSTPPRCGYEAVIIGSLDVLPFATFHDAAEPVGFLIRSRKDGDTLMFATDTVNLAYQFPPLNMIALECNYSAEILARATKMPEKVRYRIDNTHMEIGRACAYLERFDRTRLHTVYLLHLSDACANEGKFVDLVERVLPGVRVIACKKQV